MKWRAVLFLLAAVGMLVALPTAAQVPEIPVGIIYPRTGELARLGETVVQASLMAADDINNAGGIKSLGGPGSGLSSQITGAMRRSSGLRPNA